MASYNRVILMGNLTRDIELRYTPAGTPVTEVGLAVNDRRKGQNGEWIDETTFVDITFWGRTAEVASEYLSKGSPVFIEGRLKLDTWEKDGQKNYKLRVVCDRMQLLGGRDGSGGSSNNANSGGGSARSTPRPEATSYSQSSASAPPEPDHHGGIGGDEIPF
ncbi:single-stranded DNA-binding protein [Aureliella helgolandensis]|mgnify:CR=1 FL=1|nr:single-stranded DNA-binding protein [Aureliella helgolandensis]